MIPAGITTATVHLDAPVSFTGEPGRLHVVITPSASLIWTATGTPLGHFTDTFSLNPGKELSVELPHTDQPGFEDGFGNSFTGWFYTATVVYEKDGRRINFPARDFQILSGQEEVDLALVPAGQAAPVPEIAPILPVTSIDGYTGAVTKTILGLERVNNTTDAEKPVSTAAQAALDKKVDLSMVDARRHGLLLTGTADSAPALNAAAVAARAAGLPLFIPKATIYIDSTVDLRYLDVICEANIVVRQLTSIGVIVGDTSAQRNARRIELVSVKHTSTPLTAWDFPFPAIRVIGLKGATVRIGNCSLLELRANAAVATDDSIAYNTFEIQRINHIRLWGEGGSGWINENLFLGGSSNRVTIGGTYQHNHNKFIKLSIEGAESLIDIQNGSQNLFEDARSEGGTKVKFGAGTWKNYVIGMFIPHPNLITSSFIKEEDLGADNTVTSRDLIQHRAHTIFKLDSTTPLFDTSSSMLNTAVPLPVPSVGVGRLAMGAANQRFIDTGLIRIEEARDPAAANETTGPPSRVSRFVLHCDASVMRPYVSAYDANGVLIDANTTPWVTPYGGFTANGAGEYGFGTTVSSMVINVTNVNVKYLRFTVMTSLSTNPLFSHITLTAYVQSDKQPSVIESMRNRIIKPLFSAAQPSRGLASVGTVVQGPGESWKSVARVETTLSAAAAVGTAITVTSATGIAVGDVIGVLMSDGRTHWTTVAALAGTSLTLAAALTATASAGGAVGTTRWAPQLPIITAANGTRWRLTVGDDGALTTNLA